MKGLCWFAPWRKCKANPDLASDRSRSLLRVWQWRRYQNHRNELHFQLVSFVFRFGTFYTVDFSKNKIEMLKQAKVILGFWISSGSLFGLICQEKSTKYQISDNVLSGVPRGTIRPGALKFSGQSGQYSKIQGYAVISGQEALVRNRYPESEKPTSCTYTLTRFSG